MMVELEVRPSILQWLVLVEMFHTRSSRMSRRKSFVCGPLEEFPWRTGRWEETWR